MPNSVTIHSKTAQGGAVELTVEKSGADSGKLTAKTWTKANPGPADKPAKTDAAKLYDVRLSANPTKVTCKASVFGPDPDVTCTLNPGAGNNSRSVTITIKGTLGGVGEGTTVYPLAEVDYTAIGTFLDTSGFPAA